MAKKAWDKLSSKEIKQLQEKKLNKFIREQIRFAPFYQYHPVWKGAINVFLNNKHDDTMDMFRKLPFTNKSDYIKQGENAYTPKDLILQPDPDQIKRFWPKTKLIGLLIKKILFGQEYIQKQLLEEYLPVDFHFTTGRSADPIPFGLSQYDINIMKISGQRIVEILGLNPKIDKGVNLFPYVPHLGFWQAYYACTAGLLPTVHTGGGKCLGTEKIIRTFDRIHPTILFGVPSYTYHVLKLAKEKGVDLSSIKIVAMGGEKVSMSLREKIKNIVGTQVRVASVFGMTESKHCWTECLDKSGKSHGFHTYPDLDLFEVIDPKTERVLPPGETGELVYTGLDSRGSSLLRYRTGDIVEGGILESPCPNCNRTTPRISSDIGRKSNIVEGHFEKIKDSFINFNLVGDALNEIKEIEQWQIIIKHKDNDPDAMVEMNLHISMVGDKSDQSVISHIAKSVSEVSEARFNNIEQFSNSEMLDKIGLETQTKETRILDLRKKG